MNRKALTLLLALFIAASVVSNCMAEFDYSVFDKKRFNVAVDPMTDEGIIEYKKSEEWWGVMTDSNKKLITLDIMLLPSTKYLLPNGIAALRMRFYLDDLIKTTKLILLTDKTRYTIEVEGVEIIQYGTKKEEWVTIGFSDPLIQMVEEIIDKKITFIQYRLYGSVDDIDGFITIDIDLLNTLYEYYIKAGGLEQVLSVIEFMYPISVKQL